tara:strand:- start:127 stop:552 length:426 start_codon:yes stop_codon:yes gene_type:complete
MVYGQGTDPRTATLKSSTTVSGAGLLLTNDSTNNTLDLCADGEVAIGVSAADSSRDVDGTLETSGATVSFYPLGSVLMIQSEASQTYTTGLLVYAGANGQCIDSNDHTSKVVGVYVGTGEEVGGSGAGTLIPVNTAGHATA